MSSSTAVLVGVAIAGVVGVGLVMLDRSHAAAQRAQMSKDDPTILPVGLFPALKVGDVLLIDTALARLPSPFDQLPRVPAQVDRVLQDPNVVSVQTPPGPRVPGLPFFSGTIPKEAILNVAPSVPVVKV